MTPIPASKELNTLQFALLFAIFLASQRKMQSQPDDGGNQITLSQYNFAVH